MWVSLNRGWDAGRFAVVAEGLDDVEGAWVTIGERGYAPDTDFLLLINLCASLVISPSSFILFCKFFSLISSVVPSGLSVSLSTKSVIRFRIVSTIPPCDNFKCAQI